MPDIFQPPADPGGVFDVALVQPIAFIVVGIVALGLAFLAGRLFSRPHANAKGNETRGHE